ncbi:hypothetical protein LTR08_005031 [Meristemomyces frigidus]|nr:hypothetical protein LTR08_005031 [Meristemomyces frigidus]
MSATFPTMKKFFGVFDSGMIGECGDDTYTGSASFSSSGNALGSVTNTPAKTKPGPGMNKTLRLRPDLLTQGQTDVKQGTRAEASAYATSVNSDDSGRAIIKKTQAWEFGRRI